MTEQQSGQVTRIMDEIKSGERDSRFEWCWVEISLHNQNGEITDFIPRGPNNILMTATIMHLVAMRMPKPEYKPLTVYNSLIKGPSPTLNPVVRPPGSGPPPPGNGGGCGGGQPPGAIKLAPVPSKKLGCTVCDSSDSSDSDSTNWSSDSSVGNVRRRLRKYKAKKERKANKYYVGSDSESEDEEDVIKIEVVLKRGDDVVKRLLEMWTVDGKGKSKVA